MRPIAIELDKIPADKAYAKGSTFWEFHQEILKLGLSSDVMDAFPQNETATLMLFITKSKKMAAISVKLFIRYWD
jgi:hypothetical protein